MILIVRRGGNDDLGAARTCIVCIAAIEGVSGGWLTIHGISTVKPPRTNVVSQRVVPLPTRKVVVEKFPFVVNTCLFSSCSWSSWADSGESLHYVFAC